MSCQIRACQPGVKVAFMVTTGVPGSGRSSGYCPGTGARSWGALVGGDAPQRTRAVGAKVKPEPLDIAGTLTAAGIVPGTDLATAIERRGWRWSVEPLAGSKPGGHRYMALVVAPGDPRDQHARGRGATEEAALAQALARMLVSMASVAPEVQRSRR